MIAIKDIEYVWYDNPVGFLLYRRDVENGTELPVFIHTAAPVWNAAKSDISGCDDQEEQPREVFWKIVVHLTQKHRADLDLEAEIREDIIERYWDGLQFKEREFLTLFDRRLRDQDLYDELEELIEYAFKCVAETEGKSGGGD